MCPVRVIKAHEEELVYSLAGALSKRQYLLLAKGVVLGNCLLSDLLQTEM